MREQPGTGRGIVLKRFALSVGVALAGGVLVAPSASVAVGAQAKARAAAHYNTHKKHASAPKSHGQRLKLALHASQSNNWFGYNQGALEQGGKLFNSITGNWRVPRATQHRKGQAESSSDWIGIGGGCVDSACTISDPTLIQTGTEQDVSASGKASYAAWYELIPLPSFSINMKVKPGDLMHASLRQTLPGVWTITLKDVTRHETYSNTMPYTSSQDSAEWIEETPLVLGANAGFAALPNLTKAPFTDATTNGAAAHLKASEEIDLVNSSGRVIGAPSAPKRSGKAFDACAWASSCS
jgi:Peptidase A4 family